MTADRSDELVRAMLERRAPAPPPWLADETMRSVRTAPQRRARRSGGIGAITSIGLVAVLGVLAVGLIGLTLGSRLLDGEQRTGPGPSSAAAVVEPSSLPTAAVSPSAVGSSASPDATPPDVAVVTPPPVLEPDSLAVVTDDGDRLRVRTKPGIGTDSKPLAPLLEAGTRMLVVDGPVEADGYSWYEVLVERTEGLFGWVATGKDGDAWIAPIAPDCTGSDTWPLAIADIDSLACFGNRPMTIEARVAEGLGPLSEGVDAADFACPDRVDRGGCDVTQTWLRFPDALFAARGEQASDDAYAWVAIPPGSPPDELEMHDGDTVVLSGQWDAPEARDCRVLDPQTGEDVVSRDEAITRCRVAFVVRSIERQP